MSDIHIDKLNNSQLMLLVLLLSLVVSAATAVATLSALYGRSAVTSEGVETAQPTIIQQTINRIIERERILPTDAELAPSASEKSQKSDSVVLTLEAVENSLVQVYFGSQPFALGTYVSPNGHILVPEVLDKQRRYSTLDGSGDITFYSSVYADGAYSLLAPIHARTVPYHIPLAAISKIALGQSVLIFSGFGENAQLHSGIISQKKFTPHNTILVQPSVPSSAITNLSVVFIDNMFAGFATPYADWVTLITPDIVTYLAQAQNSLTTAE